MKYTLLLMMIVLAAACGKSDNKSGNKAVNQSFEPLHTKSINEALKLKYDDISVNCALRVQENQRVNLNIVPTQTFSWKILTEQKDVKTFDISIGEYSGTISYKLSEIHMIDSFYYTSPGGYEYQLESTPSIDIQSVMSLKHRSQNIGMHRDGLELELVENTGVITTTRFYQFNRAATHLLDLRCSLDTKIKPSYRHQFIEVK